MARQAKRQSRSVANPGNSDICGLSIREIGGLYRTGRLSPVEVVEAFLERIGTLNPKLNAIVTVTAEAARIAARKAEQTLRERDDLPPLFGIPYTVKDTLPTAGVRTTFGSRLFSDFMPEEDAAAVAAVKRAGGIMLGKTNSPTLGWIAATHNKVFGSTPNPWDTSLTAGGSSGGAAVAAATQMAPVNIGTDGGGSLRIPASFTGTVGFKPSYGRVPNYPTGPNWGLQHIGPIARTIDDAALALDALAAPDDRDPYSLPPPEGLFAASDESPAALRILFAPDLGFSEAVDPEVVTVCRTAALAFRQLGHEVTEGNPGWSSPLPHWQTLFVAGVAGRLGHFVAERSEDIEDKLLEFIAAGQRMAPDAYYRAWLAKNEFWQEVRRSFEQYDLLITPTVACPPFLLGRDSPGTVAGRPVSFYGWMPYSAPFNMTGQPAISVPAGFTAKGLPVGLQLVGRRLADRVVLGAARAYERARPWADQFPPLLAEAASPQPAARPQ
jgi:aspartyl-tRNA(Asn)/glutamyl-tRNA(Gln) amidotransferase subunit A